ncbi:tetratricopeptide repeat protein [Pseudomonas fluorescens group sp. PF-69]
MKPDIPPVSPSNFDPPSSQPPVWSRLRLPNGQRAGEVVHHEAELDLYCQAHFQESWSSLSLTCWERQVEHLTQIERRVDAFQVLLEVGQAPSTLKWVFKQMISSLESLVGDGFLAAQLLIGQIHLRVGHYFHSEISEFLGITAIRAAIDQGSTYGFSTLGDYYLTESRFEEAIEAYSKGSEQNCAMCIYQLAQLHAYSVHSLESPPPTVFALYERAFALGFPPAAVGMVRVWLESSESLPLPAHPIEMMKQAVEQGCSGARLVLAELYTLAAGRMQSLHDAVSMYRCAAIEGDSEAQVALAGMLQNPTLRGLPIQTDTDEAIEWYKKAIVFGAGSPHVLKEAHAELGRLYMWKKWYGAAAAELERAISCGCEGLVPLLDACRHISDEF